VTSPAKNQENQKTTEEIVAGFVGRLGEGDAEGIGKLFADEIDWYVPGQSTATADKVVIDGDDAVVFSTFSHTVIKNGKRLNNPAALHLTIANGQIVRMHLYEDTLAVHEAFKD
jgi:ketosteroid isomerase-like protein